MVTSATAGSATAKSQAASRGSAAATVLPRFVIAAPGSGHGKTTVATGLMGALRAEGLAVAGFKIGPDYIDPGYHSLATGRPGRNLDPHLCRPEQLAPLMLHGAATPEPADVAVIEGVMGLFDGQIGGDGFASTAHVAGLLDAPVILVLDISQVSRTAAAIVHGLNTFAPDVRLSGVILNKAGSRRHAAEIVEAMAATGLEVLGVLPRDAGIEAPSRHLGLVPAAERGNAAASIARLADQVREHLSLTGIMALAHAAPPLTAAALSLIHL
jgi:cobyrinic acid a,c-diamide synthase